MGLEAKQSKGSSTSNSRSLPKPVSSEFINTYVPPPLEMMHDALKQRQAAYDRNKKYMNDILNWILKLKTETDEKQFLDAMDRYYYKLRSFEGKDLSLLGKEIDNIALGVKEEMDKYTKRVEEANDPNKYMDAGIACLDNQDFRCAILNFDRVIELDPDHPETYFFRGVCYEEMNNIGLAMSDYSRYLRLNPHDPDGYNKRGWLRYAIEDFSGALSDFNNQVDLEPHSAEAYSNRGSAKSALKDFNGASLDYKKALSIDPGYSEAYIASGWDKLKLKKYSEALAELNKAIALDKSKDYAFMIRAEVKFNLKDYKGCMEDAEMCVKLNPNQFAAMVFYGRASHILGDKENACEVWRRAGPEGVEYISKYCNK